MLNSNVFKSESIQLVVELYLCAVVAETKGGGLLEY